MGDRQNPARTLIEKIWGTNFLDSIPAEWRSALRLKREKTPGVKNGSDPDTPTVIDVDNLEDEVIATSQVTTNRINELEKETTKIQWTLLLESVEHGQDLDNKLGLIYPWTKHLALDNTETGDANKEIRPLNPILSEVKEYDFSAVTAFAATFLIELTGKVNLDLPVELVSLTAIMEKNSGNGSYSETGSGFAFEPGGWSLSIPGSGEGSATIIPELIPVFKHRNGRNVQTSRYIFLLPLPISASDVANKLTALGVTTSTWPKFSERPDTIILTGQELALQVKTSAQESDSLSGDTGEGYSESSGAGYSKRAGLILRLKELPPTIHGTINIGGTTSDAQAVSAYAHSSTGAISATESQTGTVQASVYPLSLSPTPNATSVPTSGKYVLPADAEPYLPGYALVHAEVVDFANVG